MIRRLLLMAILAVGLAFAGHALVGAPTVYAQCYGEDCHEPDPRTLGPPSTDCASGWRYNESLGRCVPIGGGGNPPTNPSKPTPRCKEVMHCVVMVFGEETIVSCGTVTQCGSNT